MNRWIIRSVVAVQLILLVLLAYHLISTTFVQSLPQINWQLYDVIEMMVILVLVWGTMSTMMMLRTMSEDHQELEKRLAAASHDFQLYVHSKFDEWGLTESERDVSVFLLKGFRIREIAALRETSEGTVKAQISAIYRKAGLSGRGEFTSYFLGELTAGF